MTIRVRYWSWFRDLTGTDAEEWALEGSPRLADLLEHLYLRHPRLGEARRSARVAVGVDYQPVNHPLRDGDEVSLFPPVQGG